MKTLELTHSLPSQRISPSFCCICLGKLDARLPSPPETSLSQQGAITKKIHPARSVLIKTEQINSDTQQLPECPQPWVETADRLWIWQELRGPGVTPQPPVSSLRHHDWTPCLSKIKHAPKVRRAPLSLRLWCSHQSNFVKFTRTQSCSFIQFTVHILCLTINRGRRQWEIQAHQGLPCWVTAQNFLAVGLLFKTKRKIKSQKKKTKNHTTEH